jgi:chitinase
MIRSRLFSLITGASAIAAGGGLLPATVSADDNHRLPTHVFAPYYGTWNTQTPAEASKASGAKFVTLAFLEAHVVGSCDVLWNDDPTMPVSRSAFGADITAIRARGGDVIPSFGGFSADSSGRELADSCASVDAIAATFEKVITTYNVTRVDLDVEDISLNNTGGIDRRNKAIHKVEQWAEEHDRTIQFVYTLPTNTTGLDSTGVALLQNAVSNHARVDIVNIMTFDYYDNQPHQMATDTFTAAGHLIDTLHQLFPQRSTHQLWSMVGITEMIGIDDFGPPEIFTLADAVTVEHWAQHHGIAELSFWALQRDHGNAACNGTAGADSCSGVPQSDWQFSHLLEAFTHGGDD